LLRKFSSPVGVCQNSANNFHSVSNLGGTFPRFFILKFVDAFTVATCQPPTTSPKLDMLKGDLITQPFNCVAEAEKHRCIDGGGICNISQDGTLDSSIFPTSIHVLTVKIGYYLVNVMCVLVGAVTFWLFIRPQALKLQQLPLRAWRISDS
jgi:PAT family acetyl-CoA transporter-like MFS transporter 1